MKGLQITKKVRRYEKGIKVQKRYEVTNMVRSYEKGTKRSEATKKVRSYEHGTKLRKRYEDAKLLNFKPVTRILKKNLQLTKS